MQQAAALAEYRRLVALAVQHYERQLLVHHGIAPWIRLLEIAR